MNMDPTKIFSNNPLERIEMNMCITCGKKEMCGIYATKRALAKKEEGQEEIEDKESTELKSTENNNLGENSKTELMGEDKKQVWRILRENETYKAIKKRTRRN